MKGFLADVYLRPSCYRCRCKNGVSHSDMTIGDFWGVPKAMPDFDDDKGIGIVLLNTDKGKAMFDELDMDVRSTSVDMAKIANGGFNECIVKHPKRERFFRTHAACKNVILSIEQTVRRPFSTVIIRKIKNVKKIISSSKN